MSLLKLRPRAPATGQVMQQIGDSFRYVGRHPLFLYIMLLTFCNSLFGMAYILLMPVLAEDSLKVGAERVGWLLGASAWAQSSATGLSAASVGTARGKDNPGRSHALRSVPAAVRPGRLAVYVLGLDGYPVRGGINFSLYWWGGLSVLQELVPDGIRGRVMGLYGATWSLGPLGMAQAGFVAQYLGAPLAVAIGAWVILVMALLIYLFRPDVRNFRGRQAEPAPTEARV